MHVRDIACSDTGACQAAQPSVRGLAPCGGCHSLSQVWHRRSPEPWWCFRRRPEAAAEALADPPDAETVSAVPPPLPPPPQGHQPPPPPPPPPPAAAEAAALLVPTGAPETAVGVETAVVATAVVAAGMAPAYPQATCLQSFHRAFKSLCLLQRPKATNEQLFYGVGSIWHRWEACLPTLSKLVAHASQSLQAHQSVSQRSNQRHQMSLQAAYRTCGGGASGGGPRQTLPRWMPRWTLRKWLQMPGAGRGCLQGRAALSNTHVVTCIAACNGPFPCVANKRGYSSLRTGQGGSAPWSCSWWCSSSWCSCSCSCSSCCARRRPWSSAGSCITQQHACP